MRQPQFAVCRAFRPAFLGFSALGLLAAQPAWAQGAGSSQEEQLFDEGDAEGGEVDEEGGEQEDAVEEEPLEEVSGEAELAAEGADEEGAEPGPLTADEAEVSGRPASVGEPTSYSGRFEVGWVWTLASKAVELRFGPYDPQLDEGTAEPTLSDFFGSDKRYQLGLELDWRFAEIRSIGSVAAGFGIGYTRRTGPDPAAEDGSQLQDRRMRLLPMHVALVFRLDSLMQQLEFPLVPYGKLGVGYVHWSIGRKGSSDELGAVERVSRGSGDAVGLYSALGGMLLLDIFDESAARKLDEQVGIENSYWFLEWSKSSLEDDNGFALGASSWVTGLALQM